MEQKIFNLNERIENLQKKAANSLCSLMLIFEKIFRDIEVNVNYRIKTRESIIRKCGAKNLHPEDLTDILGIRLIGKTKDFVKILRKIFHNFNVKSIEDFWFHPTNLGYRSLHLLVKVGGLIVELQIHTAVSSAFALLCHEFYKGNKELKNIENLVLVLRKNLESEAKKVNFDHLNLLKCGNRELEK